jgi:uncharacterized membrane protein YccC
MTEGTSGLKSAHSRPWSDATVWIKAKDPGLQAVKGSVRAAVTMPLVFGLAHLFFSNPQVSLFGAFGSFALLLMVNVPGRPRTRLVSYVALLLVGSCFITLGTIVSTHKVPAVVAMALVGFVVLFAGVVSPQIATASTAAILTFVLPVAVAQPIGAIGPRLLGWVLAGAFCVPACMVIWPAPWHDNLRRRLSATVSAIGRLATARAEHRSDPECQTEVRSELELLREQFAGTPYPPTGAAVRAVALSKLVGRVEWVAGSTALVSDATGSSEPPPLRMMIATVAETLQRCASLICDGNAHPVDDPALIRAVRESTQRLDQLIKAELDTEVSTLIDTANDRGGPARSDSESGPRTERHGIASALDPSFRARALGIATQMVADATLEAAGAQDTGDRRLGVAGEAPSHISRRRLISHFTFRSVWFRNAVRGAAGLALAVAVVEATDVEHGFWVVLGTLSVLRSNALGTGSTALRAVGGTAVGFVVGSTIMIGVGNHLVLLWLFLPLAMFVSGVAPSMISFAGGQAGFTLMVIILFNIIEPTGWRVGLTRIEDVAIGCGVSIVVGLLFWPRGATAALGRALSDAFVKNSGYLADSVNRLTTPIGEVNVEPAQRASHSAYILLDDAFRQFLTERGAKVVSVDTVTRLYTGTHRIRLAAFTLGNLPTFSPEPGRPELDSVAVAGAVLRDSYASSHRWYEEFADLLADRRDALDPPPFHVETLHGVLREAFEDARLAHRGDRLRTALQMLWADELLETQRQVQVDLAASADLFAQRRRKGVMI